MKLFSRKALVAGAAAVALSFAGTSVAAAAENDPAVTTTSEAPAPNEPGNNGDGGSSSKDGEDNGLSSQDPKDISAWISVFTAVIGALGALFAFASKHLGFKL